MRPRNYSTLFSDWQINLEAGEFSSPPSNSEPPDQFIIFNSRVKDGSISASVTPLAGQHNADFDYQYCECAILFRYTNRNQYYLAGIGGFGRKFFIAQVSPSEWRPLDMTGFARDLQAGVTYHLRVEFTGDRITLFHNDVPVLSTIDSTYSAGFCGLRRNRTEAKFTHVDIEAVRPKGFVIMPFDPELDFVFQVIEETLEQYGIDCRRADQRYISEPIMEDVKTQIASAELVVVDFTNRNPNVYFEAGLADAWKKKWIVLAQSTNDLAFDVQHIRTIIYSNKMGADAKLKEDLKRALRETLGSVEDRHAETARGRVA